MKIQNEGPGALTNATDPLARTKAAEQDSAAKTRAAGGGADALTLSADAQMLQALQEQSTGAPAVRQDLVDRMRALLDAGQLGNDTGALADALIDDLTNR